MESIDTTLPDSFFFGGGGEEGRLHSDSEAKCRA